MPTLSDLIPPFLQRPRAERLALIESVRKRRWVKNVPQPKGSLAGLLEDLDEDEPETGEEEEDEE